jgi:hypothetical protein
MFAAGRLELRIGVLGAGQSIGFELGNLTIAPD